jgi:hypothetical protein
LHTNDNVVDLVVAQTIPGYGVIHAVYVGPQAPLERAYRWVMFASIDILRVYNGQFSSDAKTHELRAGVSVKL